MQSQFWLLIVLSAVLNLVALTGSIYLMLVYDSILPSGSGATLAALTVLIAFLYIGQAWFDMVRQRLLVQMAHSVDNELAGHFLRLETYAAASGRDMHDGGPLLQLDQIRQFFGSLAPVGLLDLPWVILFLAILMMMHPLLALTTVVGVMLLAGWAWRSETITVRGTKALTEFGRLKALRHGTSRRNAPLVKALGITDRMSDRTENAHRRFVTAQTDLAQRTALHGSVGRAARLFVQSAVLAVGALLVIDGRATGGIIFASAIIAGRALAPIDQVLSHWRSIVSARVAWSALRAFLNDVRAPDLPSVSFDRPEASLALERAEVVSASGNAPLFPAFDLYIKPGQFVTVIGRSGAGKSSLLRTLAGITSLNSGAIRLGGVPYSQWSDAALGGHLGYMPQTVDLFIGKIAENIARFDPESRSENIVIAARSAGVHDNILALPDGYDTVIEEGGRNIAGGLCQRIALARALYGDPPLLILDEPSSNLDPEGIEALLRAIRRWVAAGKGVIVVSHHRVLIDQANALLLLQAGELPLFGPRDAILAHANPPRRGQSENFVDLARKKGA